MTEKTKLKDEVTKHQLFGIEMYNKGCKETEAKCKKEFYEWIKRMILFPENSLIFNLIRKLFELENPNHSQDGSLSRKDELKRLPETSVNDSYKHPDYDLDFQNKKLK